MGLLIPGLDFDRPLIDGDGLLPLVLGKIEAAEEDLGGEMPGVDADGFLRFRNRLFRLPLL